MGWDVTQQVTVQSISSIPVGSGRTIPPGTGITLGTLSNVALFASYDIGIAVTDALQGTTGHALTYQVTLAWYDDMTSNIPVFVETWNPWVLTNLGSTQGCIGTGPMHGQFLTVTLTNTSIHALTINYVNLFGSSRTVSVSDWRQNYGNHVSDSALTEIATIGTGFENSLADTGGAQTLAASTGYLLPLDLYAGPVLLYFEVVTGIVVTNAAILDIGTNQETSGNIGSDVGPVYRFGNSASVGVGVYTQQIILPRSACALKIVTGSSGGTVCFKATAQQGP